MEIDDQYAALSRHLLCLVLGTQGAAKSNTSAAVGWRRPIGGQRPVASVLSLASEGLTAVAVCVDDVAVQRRESDVEALRRTAASEK